MNQINAIRTNCHSIPTGLRPSAHNPAGIGKCPTPILLWVVIILSLAFIARAESVSIVLASNAAPRVEFGAQKLAAALKAINRDASIVRSANVSGPRIYLRQDRDPGIGREGFAIELMANNDQAILAGDDSGALYGCL